MKRRGLSFLLVALLMASFLVLFAGKEGQPTPVAGSLDMSMYQLQGTKVIQYPITWQIGTYGGQFRESILGDPKTFNMAASADATSSFIIGLMFDSLFEIDPNTKDFVGNLAESYQIILDEKYGQTDPQLKKPAGKMEIVVKLRRDVKWSDGKPFTADDVVYYHNKVILNENILINGYNSYFLTMPDKTQQPIKCEKVDQYTVKYLFPRIIANPLLRISYAVMPKHIIEPVISKDDGKTFKTFWNAGTNPKEFVVNGPFIVEQYITNSMIVMTRNKNYWKKDAKGQRLPYLDKIVISIVKDQNADLLRFKNGESDIYGMRGEDYKALVNEQDKLGIDIWSGGPTLGTTFFVFNQNPNKVPAQKLRWFTNKKFRQAFSMLIDRETIVINVLDGIGAPQLSPTPVQSPMYDPNVKNVYMYNPAKAKQFFAEMGWKDTNGDGFLEDDKGVTVEFEMLTNAGNTVRERILNIVNEEAKKAGLKTTARPIDFNTLVSKLTSTFDWECIQIGLTGSRYPETGENVWMPDGNLHMWYPLQEDIFNPAYPWELEIVKNFLPFKYEVDQAKRKVYWSNILKILCEELPLIYTVQSLGLVAVKRGIKNFYYDVVIGIDRRYLFWEKKQ
ncbi:MAG: ABC transporter substrate-binding protein [Spirochaetes bacterium]|nr:ABC transporter substrate-binding protein [Spirochaetota bacterium]